MSKPQIVVALLAHNRRELTRQIRITAGFTRFYHLDIMDGRFVPSRSIGPLVLKRQEFDRPLECHLMVADPWPWLGALLRQPLRRIIVHVELGRKLLPVIALAKSKNIKIDLAVKLSTSLKKIAPYAKYINGVQLMSVAPGRYGRRFNQAVLQRIRASRRQWPRLMISVDGGINLGNINRLVKAGAKRLIIGSGIIKSAHPDASYRDLTHAINPRSVVK